MLSHNLLRAVIGVAIVLTAAPRAEAQPLGGEVHGSIYALIRGKETLGSGAIFLPNISIYLQNTATAVRSPAVATNLDGTFAVPPQPQAQYKLCWTAPGFAAGCAGTSFVLGSVNVNLQPVGIIAQPGVLYGRVALKDGTACRFVNPFMGKNTFTQVSAKPTSGPAHIVRANSYGEYVIPQLPQGSLQLRATCEAASAAVNTNLNGTAVVLNLTLPNARPTTGLAYAAQAGRMVRAAAAGSTVHVTVQARDGGGYPLHYRWAVDPPVGGFVSPDAPAVDWKLPSVAGFATIYVLAYDGRGGNVLSRVKMSTNPNRIDFSGHVLANNAPSVPGAFVTINGVANATNANGDFEITLPKEEPRYVVTITKPGYQMLSRILYAPATQALFKLYAAQDTVANPTTTITVVERTAGEQKTGAQIDIPANSLAAGATGTGSLATAPLHIQVRTYDLHDGLDQIPGDYGGISKSNLGVRMQTYGATDIAVYDGAGQPFNLAPGKQAVVTLAIDPALQASAPATIPVWHYDTGRGLWVEDGIATKVGGAYQTTVTHFSAVNMDLSFNNAACTRIVVDTGIMPVPFRLQMTPLTGGFTVAADHQNQTVGDSLNVVVREPPGIQVRFDVIDSNGNPISAASQTITTGAASASGSAWNPPPNPPYADCTSEVDYNEQTVKALFPTPPQGFLQYLTPAGYLCTTFPNCPTAEGLASGYYGKIDPSHAKTTPGDTNDFAHWKTANGFDRSGETRVDYQNLYDLGFGRDMHMQTGGQDGSCGNCIAYYVTNYANADDALNGVNNKATVAMEFSPQNGSSGTPYTKFYVFNPDGSIANSVALDDFGPKYVPALCVICHNGNLSSADPTGNLQIARFIPFDLDSFAYPTTLPRASQEASFKAMNAGILNHTNVSGPVKLLIDHWYGTEGDNSLPNPTFNGANIPSLWTSPKDESLLYNAVVKTSCRSCHTTRDPNDTGQDIAWDTYDSLNQDSTFVHIIACSSTGAIHHMMPQAERTFARFWLSTAPNAPDTFAASDLLGFQAPSNNCQ